MFITEQRLLEGSIYLIFHFPNRAFIGEQHLRAAFKRGNTVTKL